jgi:hypothetical protein
MKNMLGGLFGKKSESPTEKEITPQKFIAQSFKGLQMATQAHASTWGLGSEQNWDVDLNLGTITFTFADGKVATAPIQVVGTYAPNGTFLWGYDHPSVKDNLGDHAKRVKEFGEKHNIDEILTQPAAITQEKAWEYTALCMRLGDYSGAYRGHAGGGTYVFLTFGEVKLSKK